ncbi:MAG: type VI immunity family protein, partial [Archangium sp.]
PTSASASMTLRYPRVRIPGPVKWRSWSEETQQTVEHTWDRLTARDTVRIIFFMPVDYFFLGPGVSRALDIYVRAVEGCPGALSEYWLRDSSGPLSLHEWTRIREAIHRTARWAARIGPYEAVEEDAKDPRIPHLYISGEQDSGFCFAYKGRTPYREQPFDNVSVVRVSLPTEYLEERGVEAVRELALAMASALPFESGHAGLALECWGAEFERLDTLREVIFRHPGFDFRIADIHDHMGSYVDGVHWLNFLGPPFLKKLGGVSRLRRRLQSPSTTVQPLDRERAVVSLGPWPEVGDLTLGDNLPAYREFARVVVRFEEPIPWSDQCGHKSRPDDDMELVRWWNRFTG